MVAVKNSAKSLKFAEWSVLKKLSLFLQFENIIKFDNFFVSFRNLLNLRQGGSGLKRIQRHLSFCIYVKIGINFENGE